MHFEEHLRSYFNEFMKNEDVHLLKSFDTYEKSLPRRKINGGKKVLELYKLPYYVINEDLDTMVTNLLEPQSNRTVIKYLAAPSGYGKTSSVLQAFLRSTDGDEGFTHYFYLAFNNNADNYYRVDDTLEPSHPLDQGANFIYDCVVHHLSFPLPTSYFTPEQSQLFRTRKPCYKTTLTKN